MGKLELSKILLWIVIGICMYNILTTFSSIILFGSALIGVVSTIIAIKLNKE